MKLIQCRFSSGQRVPLLVQAGNAAPLPKLIPSNSSSDTAHIALLRLIYARFRLSTAMPKVEI